MMVVSSIVGGVCEQKLGKNIRVDDWTVVLTITGSNGFASYHTSLSKDIYNLEFSVDFN